MISWEELCPRSRGNYRMEKYKTKCLGRWTSYSTPCRPPPPPTSPPANSQILLLSGMSRKNNLLWEVMGLLKKLNRCPQGSGLQQKPTITSQQEQRAAAHLFTCRSTAGNDMLFGKYGRCPDIFMQIVMWQNARWICIYLAHGTVQR